MSPARPTSRSSRFRHVLRWAGLEWDEGPYLQRPVSTPISRRASVCSTGDHAYECFCTADEVRERNEQRRARAGRRLRRWCRDLTPAERQSRIAAGTRDRSFPHARRGTEHVRRRRPGEESVEWSTISDFVIVPVERYAGVLLGDAVDDIDMNITHVLRGDDLLDSTHRVLALRRALGHDDQPVYAHSP